MSNHEYGLKKSYRSSVLMNLGIIVISIIVMMIASITMYKYSMDWQRNEMTAQLIESTSKSTALIELQLKYLHNDFLQLALSSNQALDFCRLTLQQDKTYNQYLTSSTMNLGSLYFNYYHLLDSAMLYITRDNVLNYRAKGFGTYSLNKVVWDNIFDVCFWEILNSDEQYLYVSNSPQEPTISLTYLHSSPFQNINTVLNVNISSKVFTNMMMASNLSTYSGYMLVSKNHVLFTNDAQFQPQISEGNIIDAFQGAVKSTGLLEITSDTNVKYWVAYDTISLNGWRIGYFIPDIEFMQHATQTTMILIFTFLLLTLLLMLFTLILVRQINRPVSTILKKIDGMNPNNLDISFSDINTRSREARLLINGLSGLMNHSRDLISKVEVAQNRKRHAEFNALQTQINPHLLYNTLFSIKQLCDMNDSERAGDMVIALADFYRGGIRDNAAIVSLQKEFEITRHFLEICRIRYGSVFSYEMILGPETESCGILKMTLQPITENALKHAFPDTITEMKLLIYAKKEDDNLIISIIDNGCGFTIENAEMLNSVMSGDNSNETTNNGHIGLQNVNQRIRQYYGNLYGLTIDTKYVDGAKIDIKIPLREISADENTTQE